MAKHGNDSRMVPRLTARASIQFLWQSTLDFIELEDRPSKSPDLNVMDYCIWSLLLTEIQNCRCYINSIDWKTCLGRAWNDTEQVTLQNATRAWLSRLRRCSEVYEQHF